MVINSFKSNAYHEIMKQTHLIPAATVFYMRYDVCLVAQCCGFVFSNGLSTAMNADITNALTCLVLRY
jgi:hypothetical protein